MAVRVGFLSVAHMHAWGYAKALQHEPRAVLGPVWDENSERAAAFALAHGIEAAETIEQALDACDAVVVTSDNRSHAELCERAARAGRHILCEKPLVTSEEEGARLIAAVDQAGVKLMTAFPCRYSPAFQRLVERVRAGDIGPIRAVCATNRGRCPFDWFVDPERSGGGAMIDHVVHVADLLRVLIGEDVVRVQAMVGNNMYGEEWEDTAMLTLEFPGGVFATLDSSWSRTKSYKTWGDVAMNVVGDGGVIELNLFGQALDVFDDAAMAHRLHGYGSDLDSGLVADFVRCVEEDSPPPITAHDGLQAARVALAGYASMGASEPAVPVSA
ncbi:MAG: Gfo/Idh/MocA family oxidoreductase [Fimbriimonadaceae bacterium]|nr:Gfo/Idh/MocA family oxidoreductase [Chthonomonadaceae bacterium]MCO5298195.1 Gfo/Idh/MocA family oxidoreductase [Fimbriimonadaceae bacterium]